MPEMRESIREIRALHVRRRLGEVRKMRQYSGGEADHLLCRVIRWKDRGFRLVQVVAFLRQLFEPFLQYLPLKPERNRFTVDGLGCTARKERVSDKADVPN
jgi:hypothetical protein